MKTSAVAIVIITALAVVSIADQSLAASTRASITLVNNGYEGIVIAISETVPVEQSDVILGRLKRFFTQASMDLFTATRKRVYFRKITILVPKSWSNRDNYEVASSETFSSANIVIDGREVDTPMTSMSDGCGQPGHFIQIPVGYMTAPMDDIINIFGLPGRTLVHEWGHLRWGLRDEYPVNDYPAFYRNSDGMVTAVKCGKYMWGDHVDYVTGDECTLDRSTRLPSNTCYFEPRFDAEVEASIMFYHNVSGVWTFCDNDTSNWRTLHNDEAPNIHNVMCRGRSAWEVMRDHEDFKNGNNPPIIERSQNTAPTFRIVQAKRKRIVLVLDVSGSMREEFHLEVTRLQRLRQTVTEFILNVVPPGYLMGLVTFNNNALIAAGLTPITSQDDRHVLVTHLPTSVDGDTSIGKGLLKGVEVLEANNVSAGGGILVLVSDGQETRRPYIVDVTPDLIEKGVIVHTVLLTDKAADRMIKLASDTEGKSFYESGLSNTTDLLGAFKTAVTGERSVSVDLSVESLTVKAGGEIKKYVFIDPSVGRDSEFSFSYSGNSFPLKVVLTSPSGQTYTGSSNDATKQMTVSPNATNEVGRWIVVLTNPGRSDVITMFRVTSKPPTDDTHPITIDVSLSHTLLDYDNKSTLKLIVKTKVKRGYASITGAKVEVQAGSLSWKLMKDDGIGVDAVNGDGFYTGFLFDFPSDNKYPVRVRVTADEDKARVLVRGGTRAFRRSMTIGGKIIRPTYEVLQTFQRTAAAGLIKITNRLKYPDLRTIYPFEPPVFKDLRVTGTSNKTVTLQWTAVGDFEEQERALSYDLRYSTDIKALRHAFENASKINAKDVISGNLDSPANASEPEAFVLRFPSAYFDKTLFFGVKVIYRGNRTSAGSNIVSAGLVLLSIVEASSDPGSSFILYIIVGALGLMFLVVVIAALIILCKACQCNNRSSVRFSVTVPRIRAFYREHVSSFV